MSTHNRSSTVLTTFLTVEDDDGNDDDDDFDADEGVAAGKPFLMVLTIRSSLAVFAANGLAFAVTD